MPDTLRELTRQVRDYLFYFSELGVESLPRVRPASDPPGTTDRDRSPTPAPSAKQASQVETLDHIRADIGDCRRCPLCRDRTHIVFGEGPSDAKLMFIGEGPGRDEDLSGRPFVGAAGRRLTDIIVKGIKIGREECYIANIVKCRPPGNRDPLVEEAEACLPFLERQIAVIKPKVICALGRVASHHLLKTDAPLNRLRRRFHDYRGIPVMPTYHPSALLRDDSLRRPVWEDIKLVISKLEE
jgi:uracil-DNA glycosylase